MSIRNKIEAEGILGSDVDVTVHGPEGDRGRAIDLYMDGSEVSQLFEPGKHVLEVGSIPALPCSAEKIFNDAIEQYAEKRDIAIELSMIRRFESCYPDKRFKKYYSKHVCSAGADIYASLKVVQALGNMRHLELISDYRKYQLILLRIPLYTSMCIDAIIDGVDQFKLKSVDDDKILEISGQILKKKMVSYDSYEGIYRSIIKIFKAQDTYYHQEKAVFIQASDRFFAMNICNALDRLYGSEGTGFQLPQKIDVRFLEIISDLESEYYKKVSVPA